MSDALKMTNVSLSLPSAAGTVHILRGVNFSLEPGECVAIVGPSGSGKSSLISVAAGLERASGGQVELLGTKIDGQSEDALARLRRGRVSLVFQSFHLLPTMTARDNVQLPVELSQISDARAKAEAALSDGGLGHRMTHFPGQLSGGERQRVAVARALASDPELVFADEPTGNLDAQSGEGVADRLFAIARERKASLVLVTHDLDLAKRADRIVTMKDGLLT